jgi:hypothetical protein
VEMQREIVEVGVMLCVGGWSDVMSVMHGVVEFFILC